MAKRKRIDEPEDHPIDDDDAEVEVSSARGMIIQINPDWRMQWDGLQWCCQHRRETAEGKTKGTVFWDNKAYCTSFDNAIWFLASRRIYGVTGHFGFEAVEVLGNALDEVKAQIKAALAEAIKKGAHQL